MGAAKLRGFVVEQALWVGVMGVAVMAALTLALWCLARIVHVALSFPAWTLVAAAGFVLLIALVASLASIGVLYKTQPADLLR